MDGRTIRWRSLAAIAAGLTLAGGLAGGLAAAVPAVAATSGVRQPTAARAAVTPAAALAAPRVPFVESAGATGLGILVAWAPPAAADKVRGFAITATPAQGSPPSCPAKTVSTAASSTQALVQGLCAGVVYTATVKAYNAAGYSQASPASSPVVPLVARVPGAPLITSVVPRPRALIVSWARPADDGGRAITGYTIRVTSGSKTVKTIKTVKTAPGAATATVTGLVNKTRYAVSLTAANAVGTSAPANGAGTPAPAHRPAAPGGLTVVPNGKGHLVVSWAAPADTGGAAVTRYTISYQRAALNAGTGRWTRVAGATVHKITARALARTATATRFEKQKACYLFSITAASSAGTSPAAVQAAAVTPAVTVGPKVKVLTTATVAALATATPAALTWKDPAPAQAKRLAAGQTLVSGPGAKLPDGTLRTVTSVSDKGGTLTVATKPGRLANAFSSLGLDATVSPVTGAAASSALHTVAGAGPRFIPAMAGIRVMPDPSRPEASAGFGRSVTLSVDLAAGHVSVEAEISVDASIDVSIGVHHGFAGVPDGVSLTASAKVTSALGGQLRVSGDWNKQIGEIDGDPIVIEVGPVPVEITPKLPLFLKGTGTVGVGFEMSQTVGGSVAWSSQSPSKLATASLSSGPELTPSVVPGLIATGDLELTLTTQPQADIYDAAGPNVEGDLVLDIAVSSSGDPFLTIGPKLELKAGVDLDVLHAHASLEAAIGTFSYAAYTIKDPPAASYTISPANPSVAAGGSLTLTATRSDGEQEPLTWGLLDGTGSDSVSSGGVLQAGSPNGRTLAVTVTDPSGAAGQTTVTVGVPFGAPSHVTARQHPDDTGALLTWTAPASTGGSPVTGYTVVTEPSTGTHALGPDATSLTLPSLADGTYVVSVYATNTDGMISAPGTTDLTIGIPVPTAPRSWTAAQAPLPPGGHNAGLGGVSCPRPASCVAVGGYQDKTGAARPLILTRSGGSWVPSRPPLPSNAASSPDATLNGVSCSSSFCVIAGGYVDKSRHLDALLLTRSNGKWTAAKAKLPANAASDQAATLGGVSCASSSACVAVGHYYDKSSHEHGLVLTRSGAAWTPAQAPVPANAAAQSYTELDGVSCPSPSACVAVGGYTDKSGNAQLLVLARSGGAWRPAEEPLPANGVSGSGGLPLLGISCSPAASCVATGIYWGAAGGGRGLLLTRTGGSWTPAQAPVPPNADARYNTWVFGASCASAASCVAAGSYFDSSDSPHGLLLTRSGGSWHPAQAPLPGNASAISFNTGLAGVSCAGPATCTAVGEYTLKGSGDIAGLILTSSG
jgi:fibronectin type III domain protein